MELADTRTLIVLPAPDAPPPVSLSLHAVVVIRRAAAPSTTAHPRGALITTPLWSFGAGLEWRNVRQRTNGGKRWQSFAISCHHVVSSSSWTPQRHGYQRRGPAG